MNKQQWMFVHSWLGHTCLLIATVHVTVKAVPSWPYTRLIDILQGKPYVHCYRDNKRLAMNYDGFKLCWPGP